MQVAVGAHALINLRLSEATPSSQLSGKERHGGRHKGSAAGGKKV